MARDISEIFESIDSKLGALIALSLEDREISVREKIRLLADAGMNNQDISRLLNISAVHVAKEKSLAKKKEDNLNG